MYKKIKEMTKDEFIKWYKKEYKYRVNSSNKPKKEAKLEAYNFFLNEEFDSYYSKKFRVIYTVGRLLVEAKKSGLSLKETYKWYKKECKDERDYKKIKKTLHRLVKENEEE